MYYNQIKMMCAAALISYEEGSGIEEIDSIYSARERMTYRLLFSHNDKIFLIGPEPMINVISDPELRSRRNNSINRYRPDEYEDLPSLFEYIMSSWMMARENIINENSSGTPFEFLEQADKVIHGGGDSILAKQVIDGEDGVYNMRVLRYDAGSNSITTYDTTDREGYMGANCVPVIIVQFNGTYDVVARVSRMAREIYEFKFY